jgi:hypothetical protein
MKSNSNYKGRGLSLFLSGLAALILTAFPLQAKTPNKGVSMDENISNESVSPERAVVIAQCIGIRATGKRHQSYIFRFKILNVVEGTFPQATVAFELFQGIGGRELLTFFGASPDNNPDKGDWTYSNKKKPVKLTLKKYEQDGVLNGQFESFDEVKTDMKSALISNHVLTYRNETLGYEFQYPNDWHVIPDLLQGQTKVLLVSKDKQLDVSKRTPGTWLEISPVPRMAIPANTPHDQIEINGHKYTRMDLKNIESGIHYYVILVGLLELQYTVDKQTPDVEIIETIVRGIKLNK